MSMLMRTWMLILVLVLAVIVNFVILDLVVDAEDIIIRSLAVCTDITDANSLCDTDIFVRSGHRLAFWTLCDGGFYFEWVKGNSKVKECGYRLNANNVMEMQIRDDLNTAEAVKSCIDEIEEGISSTIERLGSDDTQPSLWFEILYESHYYQNVRNHWDFQKQDEKYSPSQENVFLKWHHRLLDVRDYYFRTRSNTRPRNHSSDISFLYYISNRTVRYIFKAIVAQLRQQEQSLYLFQNQLLEFDVENYIYVYSVNKKRLYKFTHSC